MSRARGEEHAVHQAEDVEDERALRRDVVERLPRQVAGRDRRGHRDEDRTQDEEHGCAGESARQSRAWFELNGGSEEL